MIHYCYISLVTSGSESESVSNRPHLEKLVESRNEADNNILTPVSTYIDQSITNEQDDVMIKSSTPGTPTIVSSVSRKLTSDLIQV